MHYLYKIIEKFKGRKFIFTEVLRFQTPILLKSAPFYKIISKILPIFLITAVELQYTMNSFTDTSRSETAIKDLGKIFENQFRKDSFLNLIKFHTSNFYLLKMNSFKGFSRMLFKFYAIRYGLFEFLEGLFQRSQRSQRS